MWEKRGGDVDEKISAETGKSKWPIFFILKFAVAVKCRSEVGGSESELMMKKCLSVVGN